MKEVVIISGKGGTGKTTVTASFAALADQNAVLADCDVDAADLHLLLQPNIQRREEFRSGKTATINPQTCIQCGKCREVCRFEAIDETPVINEFACEGCCVCAQICPVQAIDVQESVCGEWFQSDTSYGPMVHARLGVAAENSGKLVSIVRRQAKQLAAEQEKALVLIDGPPGIGCPVISSIAGSDLVLAVTEPTLSGLHDLRRVAELASHFSIPTAVCINKFDINPEISREIRQYCQEQGIRVVGQIPYERTVIQALVRKQLIITMPETIVAQSLQAIWTELTAILNGQEAPSE
jgi:MinD superfamily P-loop ATPase